MERVAVIDYGMCNLDSVGRALEECGARPVITSDRAEIAQCDRVLLPGVGAFPDAMRELGARGLDEVLREEVVGAQIPLLGICLGMQLLADESEEGEGAKGLGIIPGRVERLRPTRVDRHVPHIGWNEVHWRDPHLEIFDQIASGKDFYFVHSYHFVCAEEEDAVSTTPYGEGFTSVIQRGLVFGAQFHPEKSQKLGFQLLRNFLAI